MDVHGDMGLMGKGYLLYKSRGHGINGRRIFSLQITKRAHYNRENRN
jgi:hypothetical protein